MNIRFLAPLLAVPILLLAPSFASAAEVRSGPNATVAPGETVDDDLFAGGQSVTIAGRVTGDAYAFAQTVVVTGQVDGDVIAAAQQVVIDGTVSGNVRAAGAQVTINGTVGRSVTAAAQQVNVSSNGRVGGSIVAAGETINTFGPVGRGVTAAGNTLQLAGPVGGEVLARVDRLVVQQTARIAGDLDYRADQESAIPSGTVSGGVRFEQLPQRQERPASPLNGLFDLGSLIWLIGSAIVGVLAVMLLPRGSARAVELGRQQPLQSFGWGALVLIGVPIAATIVGLTLIGLPLSLTLLALYTVALLLAWPAVGLVVGTELARRFSSDRPLHVLGALFLGLIILHLVTHLPVVGGLIACVALIYGLGLVTQSVRRWRRPGSQPVIPTPVAVAA